MQIIIDERSKKICDYFSKSFFENTNSYLPIYSAYIFKSFYSNNNENYLRAETVYGIYLSIQNIGINNGVFIPLNRLKYENYRLLKKKIYKYFLQILKGKASYIPDYPLITSFRGWNKGYNYLYFFNRNSLKVNNRMGFIGLKSVLKCAKAFMKPVYRIACDRNTRTNYIEISTCDGRKLYIKINNKISLGMWLQLKIYEKNGYIGYVDGDIIPTHDNILTTIDREELVCVDNKVRKMIGFYGKKK